MNRNMVVLVTLVALVACGDGVNAPPPEPSVTFALSAAPRRCELSATVAADDARFSLSLLANDGAFLSALGAGVPHNMAIWTAVPDEPFRVTWTLETVEGARRGEIAFPSCRSMEATGL